MQRKTSLGRSFIGNFEYGDDLLVSLTLFCKKHRIKTGTFSLIGAVQNVVFGYYGQKEKRYVTCKRLNKQLEIASCIGNISELNKDIFVHAHIVCADYKGNAFGGHLMEGARIFAAEFFIQEIKNISLVRKKDPKTGLMLWK